MGLCCVGPFVSRDLPLVRGTRCQPLHPFALLARTDTMGPQGGLSRADTISLYRCSAGPTRHLFPRMAAATELREIRGGYWPRSAIVAHPTCSVDRLREYKA
jgi:hypothetical protein